MIAFAIEPLDRAMSDLQSMLPAQWQHTGDSEVECQPNWNFYRQMESHGAGLLIMAREEGRPVGYMVAFIYPHPNAVSVKIAEIRTYYIEKSRALVLNSMIDFTLQELARRGIFRIDAYTHAGHSAGRLWELKGFVPAKIGYSLKLKSREAKYA
jgi:hypothetical protein